MNFHRSQRLSARRTAASRTVGIGIGVVFAAAFFSAAFFSAAFFEGAAAFAADEASGADVSAVAAAFRFEQNDASLDLFDGDALIFSYRYAFLEHKNVPKSDKRRFAGDYLYPLNGLDGENLTDLAPKDHYHHRGVFWTWPGVVVWEPDGSRREYDLWTTNAAIRQRFIRFLERSVDGERATFAVENGWFVGDGATTPDAELDASKTGAQIGENVSRYGEKIVSEFVKISTGPVETFDGVPCRAIDFELTLIPAEKPISLRGAAKKSYGGLTIRFRPTGKIGKDDFIATDEGVAAVDMPEKTLRWADFTSKFGARDARTGEPTAPSGAAIFLSPNFPDFPPTWLTRYYGALCVGWPGVVERKFAPGETIAMKARIWIHRGAVSVETLRKAFETWAETERGGER